MNVFAAPPAVIDDEHPADVMAREALLDRAMGEERVMKPSERLRAGRLPASRRDSTMKVLVREQLPHLPPHLFALLLRRARRSIAGHRFSSTRQSQIPTVDVTTHCTTASVNVGHF